MNDNGKKKPGTVHTNDKDKPLKLNTQRSDTVPELCNAERTENIEFIPHIFRTASLFYPSAVESIKGKIESFEASIHDLDNLEQEVEIMSDFITIHLGEENEQIIQQKILEDSERLKHSIRDLITILKKIIREQ